MPEEFESSQIESFLKAYTDRFNSIVESNSQLRLELVNLRLEFSRFQLETMKACAAAKSGSVDSEIAIDSIMNLVLDYQKRGRS